MDVAAADQPVFRRDLFAVAPVDLEKGAGQTEAFTHSQRCPRACEGIDHDAAGRGCQLQAPFDQPLVQLGRMPRAALLAVAGDPGEIEDIA